ncbi:MAG: Ig-like domain-containing protein [Hyphomicrobiaceae bacterium]
MARTTLTFSASGLPAGLAIDPATGVISGTVDSRASHDGPYQVTVTATDEHGASARISFNWIVGNPEPIAVNDRGTVDAGGSLSGHVGGNDRDPDGDPLDFSLVKAPLNGELVLRPDGSFTYRPADGFSGIDRFVYEVRDADGASSRAVMQIEVLAPEGGLNITMMSGGSASSGEAGGLAGDILDPIDRDYGEIEVTYPSNVFIQFVIEEDVVRLETQFGMGVDSEILRYGLDAATNTANDGAGLFDPLAPRGSGEGLKDLEVLDEQPAGDSAALGGHSGSAAIDLAGGPEAELARNLDRMLAALEASGDGSSLAGRIGATATEFDRRAIGLLADLTAVA